MKTFKILFILFTLSCCRGIPKNYISSPDAPRFGELVSEAAIKQYLDSAKVPSQLRFEIRVDSLPNRTYYRPTGLLFKGQEEFINLRLCNAHYRDIVRTIEHCNRKSLMIQSYSLEHELKSLLNVSVDELPKTAFSLVFYWALANDNLNWRNIQRLRKSLKDNDLSLTVLYVNVDNKPEYNLSEEQFMSFVTGNRSIDSEYDGNRWFPER